VDSASVVALRSTDLEVVRVDSKDVLSSEQVVARDCDLVDSFEVGDVHADAERAGEGTENKSVSAAFPPFPIGGKFSVGSKSAGRIRIIWVVFGSDLGSGIGVSVAESKVDSGSSIRSVSGLIVDED
jgi:hypothetical protein